MITKEQARIGAQRLAALPYYPNEEYARAEISRLFLRMVESPKQLEWLITVLLDRCDRYPGIKEIRGVYCTRYKPLDGVEEYSTISGFTPGDSESQTLIEDGQQKEKDRSLPRTNELKRIVQ